MSKDQRPNKGQRTGKGWYPDSTKSEAFQLYVINRNAAEVARKMGIKICTIRLWKKKFDWDGVISKQLKEVGVITGTREMEARRAMEKIIEEGNFDELSSTALIPSAVRDLVDVPAPTDEDIMNLAAYNYFLKQYQLLMVVERKVREALRNVAIKPTSWPEVLKTIEFLSGRLRQMREDLIKSGLADKFTEQEKEKDIIDATYFVGKVDEKQE